MVSVFMVGQIGSSLKPRPKSSSQTNYGSRIWFHSIWTLLGHSKPSANCWDAENPKVGSKGGNSCESVMRMLVAPDSFGTKAIMLRFLETSCHPDAPLKNRLTTKSCSLSRVLSTIHRGSSSIFLVPKKPIAGMDPPPGGLGSPSGARWN